MYIPRGCFQIPDEKELKPLTEEMEIYVQEQVNRMVSSIPANDPQPFKFRFQIGLTGRRYLLIADPEGWVIWHLATDKMKVVISSYATPPSAKILARISDPNISAEWRHFVS